MRLLIFLVVVSGCAAPPIGSDPAMPNCVYRCVVEITEITANPELDTVTHTSGDVTATTTTNRTSGP